MVSDMIRVTKDPVFASVRLETYEGDRCEPRRGHEYQAAISLECGLGALAEQRLRVEVAETGGPTAFTGKELA